MANLLLHVCCCIDPSMPRKPVYNDKAHEWLLPSEKAFFEENFRPEQTGKISSTENFALLFQIPAYFSSSSLESLEDVLELMKGKTLGTLKNRFPEGGSLLDAYMQGNLQTLFYERTLMEKKNCEQVIEGYQKILESTYKRFYRQHWKTLVPEMKTQAKVLKTQYLQEQGLIGLWEQKTRMKFPYPQFVAELADPIGTLGTSIMAERDAFSSWQSPEKIFTVISHEIGTHTFFQTKSLSSTSFAEILTNDTERTLRIIEAFSYLVNLEIGEDKGLPITYSAKFAEYFRNEIAALEIYQKPWKDGALSSIDVIVKAHSIAYRP